MSQRLNGWKEIASFLGKSVKTVQRWEKRLGLPVRRIHGEAGEIIYALSGEIEAWQERRQGPGAVQSSGTVRGVPPSRLPRARHAIPIVVMLAAAVWFAQLVRWNPGGRTEVGNPAGWRVENGQLEALDEQGAHLWVPDFDMNLLESWYQATTSPSKTGWVLDLDDDGLREVLFISFSQANVGRFLCFNHDGSLRFAHDPGQSAAFGREVFGPPFNAVEFGVMAEGRGSSVWVLSVHHLWFPAALHRLSPEGVVTGEYWSNGHIKVVKDGYLGGRRFIAVGGTNSEFRRPYLAILDYQEPTATAPAESDTYRCGTCPKATPLTYLLFPELDLWRLFEERPYVTDVQFAPDGERLVVTLSVQGVALPPYAGLASYSAYYTLDSTFALVSAEFGDDYRGTHKKLEMLEKIDHAFDESETSSLLPVWTWDGERFVEAARAGGGEAGPSGTSGSEDSPPE